MAYWHNLQNKHRWEIKEFENDPNGECLGDWAGPFETPDAAKRDSVETRIAEVFLIKPIQEKKKS